MKKIDPDIRRRRARLFRRQVLACLASLGEANATELYSRLPLERPLATLADVRAAVSTLRDSGKVKSVSHGRYAVATPRIDIFS